MSTEPESRASLQSHTFWDWLHLLLVPVILIAGITWLSLEQLWLVQQLAVQQRNTSIQIANAQQQSTLLTTYESRISDMILHNGLRTAAPKSDANIVADTQTADVLRQLDGDHKGQLLRFLYETRLINNDTHVIDLSEVDIHGAHIANLDLRDTYLFGADLRSSSMQGTNLSYATLSYVNLAGTNLTKADLHGSDMHNTILTSTNLNGANLKDVTGLTNEQISTARSLTGTIMPDGSTHP